MINQKSSIVKKIKKYYTMFFKYEKYLLSILSVSYSSEFDANGKTDSFLKLKIMKFFLYTSKNDKKLIDELAYLFVSIICFTV